jgi:hypothetical protein
MGIELAEQMVQVLAIELPCKRLGRRFPVGLEIEEPFCQSTQVGKIVGCKNLPLERDWEICAAGPGCWFLVCRDHAFVILQLATAGLPPVAVVSVENAAGFIRKVGIAGEDPAAGDTRGE